MKFLRIVAIHIIINGFYSVGQNIKEKNYGDTNAENINSSICSPQTQHAKGFSGFLRNRWQEARRLLVNQHPNLSFPPNNNSKIFNQNVQSFNNFNSGILYWNINQTLISYARIYKCANEAIGENMNRHIRVRKVLSHEYGILVTSERHNNFVEKLRNKEFSNGTENNATSPSFVFNRTWTAVSLTEKENYFLQHLTFNPKNLSTFTFVRDPFGRFESSLTEAAYRTVLFNSRFYGFKWAINSTQDVKHYIHQLLNFTRPRRRSNSMLMPSTTLKYAFTDLEDIFHVFPMAGSLFAFPVHTIGHLETFKQDWDTKLRPLYNLTAPFDEMAGKHATSLYHPTDVLRHHNVRTKVKQKPPEPSNMRHFYRLLIEQEPVYAQVVCQLMLIDYVCLPQYPLPQVCEFLNATREEGVRLLTAGRNTV